MAGKFELDDIAVKKYQSIYLKKYGKELPFDIAKQWANELIDYLFILLPKKGGDTYEYENAVSNKALQARKTDK